LKKGGDIVSKENSVGLLDIQVVAESEMTAPKQVDTTKAYGIVPMFNNVGGAVEGDIFQYDDGGCYDGPECDECDPSPL